MLKVPDEIEGIYATDDTYYGGDVRKKYLRIKFPHGERADITNDNIVSESFSFTESICSADSFKFGLCEASEVSFETVGVENINGCVIKVYYEIDVSEPGNIASNAASISGVYISDSDNCNQTTDYGKDCVNRLVYSIPIGTFIVNSCTRNKSDMTHRDVHALTHVFETNDDMTPFELWRIGLLHKTKYFSIDVPQYIDCQTETVEIINPTDMTINDSSKKDYCFSHAPEALKSNELRIAESAYAYATIDLAAYYSTSKNYYWAMKNLFAKQKIYYFEKDSRVDTFDNFVNYIKSIDRFKHTTSNPAHDAYGNPNVFIQYYSYAFSDSDYNYDALYELYTKYFFMFGVQYSSKLYNVFNAEDNKYLYPYDNGLKNAGRVILPKGLFIRIYTKGAASGLDHDIGFFEYYEESAPYLKLMRSDTTTGLTIRFQHTLKTSAKTYRYSFYNAFSIRELVSGWLEINCKFGHQNRDGTYGYISLPTVQTRSLYPSEYESLYYEEFDIDEIGKIIYKFTDAKDRPQQIELVVDESKTSEYDMTDNGIFSALDKDEKVTDKQLKTKVENFLKTYFVPNLEVLRFSPAEIVMHAKPYLEAGDLYLVNPPTNSTATNDFKTYNLTLTMSGIQMPKEEIVSTSGQIISGVLPSEAEEDDDDDDDA